MPVILLFTATAWAGGFEAESAGIGGAMVGVPTSATYDVAPGFNAWFSADRGRLGLTGEVGFTATGSRTASARYLTLLPRIDALVELVLGTHATELRLGIGPALTVRSVSFHGGDRSVSDVRPMPGARIRLALQGPIAGKVGFGFWAGATTLGLQLGYDTGLGVSWRPE